MKTCVLSKVINRESCVIDEGTMGFHDYTTKHESMECFVDRVTMECQKFVDSGFKLIGVSYPDNERAIITCLQKEMNNNGQVL